MTVTIGPAFLNARAFILLESVTLFFYHEILWRVQFARGLLQRGGATSVKLAMWVGCAAEYESVTGASRDQTRAISGRERCEARCVRKTSLSLQDETRASSASGSELFCPASSPAECAARVMLPCRTPRVSATAFVLRRHAESGCKAVSQA